MTQAYSESYLDDTMQNLGDMLDYALVDCRYAPDKFFLGLSPVELLKNLKRATQNMWQEYRVWSLPGRWSFSPPVAIPAKRG